MRALTVCQPYANLVVLGGRNIENRTWPTEAREVIAIHAGKSAAQLVRGRPAFDRVRQQNAQAGESVRDERGLGPGRLDQPRPPSGLFGSQLDRGPLVTDQARSRPDEEGAHALP